MPSDATSSATIAQLETGPAVPVATSAASLGTATAGRSASAAAVSREK